MADDGLTGADRVRADAAARGLEVEIIDATAAPTASRRPPSCSASRRRDIVKSLVVKRSDDTYVFALVPGGRKISWPKLRALLGVNKLQLPDASLALAATGYERGTITPLGSTTAWPVVVDATHRRTPGVDGRRRARPQPVRGRRPPDRGVRRHGGRHHRPRVARAPRSRGGHGRVRARATSQPATYAGSPSPQLREAGNVADVALADHRRVGRRSAS